MDIYWVSGDKSKKAKDSSSDDKPKISGSVKSNSKDSSDSESSESESRDSESSDSESSDSDSNDRRRLGDEEYGRVYIYDFEVSMGENTCLLYTSPSPRD